MSRKSREYSAIIRILFITWIWFVWKRNYGDIRMIPIGPLAWKSQMQREIWKRHPRPDCVCSWKRQCRPPMRDSSRSLGSICFETDNPRNKSEHYLYMNDREGRDLLHRLKLSRNFMVGILGIGIDVLNQQRIASLLVRRGSERLVSRILSSAEISDWNKLQPARQIQFLAVRYVFSSMRPTWVLPYFRF